MGLGNMSAAIDVLEQAHTARNQESVARPSLAWSRWLLGRALWEAEADRVRAVEYITFA